MCLLVTSQLFGQEDQEERIEIKAVPDIAVAVAVAVAQQSPAATNHMNATGGSATPASGTPTTPPASNNSVTVVNIEDKEFKAAQVEFQDSKLIVKSDPPQSVPLNELSKVAFTHDTKLVAEWRGQVNQDLVQVGSLDEGNGIRDIHIRASGLAAKNITQVMLVSRPQFKVWKKDVTRSPYWKVAVQRIGQASAADLFFEPPARDLFESDLELTVTFEDNSTAKATIKATGHTSDSLKVDAGEGSAAANSSRLATIHLEGSDVIKGKLQSSKGDSIVIETAWYGSLEIPLSQVRGVAFDGMKPELKTKFDEYYAKPVEDDVLLVLSKDGSVTEVKGKIQSLGDDGLKLLYENQDRSIKLDRVQAVILAAHPSVRSWKGPYQTFRMASGDVVSANWQSLAEKIVQVKTPWGTVIDVPREAVVEVNGRNTKMVNVSELTPTSVEQVPYFDRTIAWVRDKAWNNRPLRLDDKTYNRGLAVHSRCVLTYDLAGEFSTFRSILGFDEEAGDRGRVVCRVLVDGKEVFVKPDFRSSDKAIPVEVAVKGGKELKLEVDFGEDEDVGDRVIWANARLYRE